MNGTSLLHRPGNLPTSTEKLRVVVLSDAIPSRNGVGTYYDDLLDHLRGHVEHVELMAPDPASRIETPPGWALSMPGDRTQKVFVPDYLRVSALVHEIRPHVIVAATPGFYGLAGLNLAYRLGVNLCVAYHAEYGKLVSLYWKHWLGSLCRKTIDSVDRFMFRCSSAVLVNNAALIEAVRDNGGRDVRLVGTPVPRSFLEPPVERPGELRSIAYVGRLALEKEVQTLLDAAERLPEIRFRIAGDGPLRPAVEQLARRCPNVEVLGWVNREGVRRLLDETDMLVLPSRLETFGTAALEAMARQRLVMVSHECGIVHWDELARGLVRIEAGETAEMAIRRVRAMSPAERSHRAAIGRSAAERINDATIQHWLDVLTHLAKPERSAA